MEGKKKDEMMKTKSFPIRAGTFFSLQNIRSSPHCLFTDFLVVVMETRVVAVTRKLMEMLLIGHHAAEMFVVTRGSIANWAKGQLFGVEQRYGIYNFIIRTWHKGI